MGVGRDCECDKCGYKVSLFLGVGMMYLHEHQKVKKTIKQGKYGTEWQKFFRKCSNGAVDVNRVLLVCEDCGNIETDYDLSLLTPVLSEQGNTTNFSEKRADVKSYVLFKKYVHKCSKCNGNMNIEDEDAELICPKCKIPLKTTGILNWD